MVSNSSLDTFCRILSQFVAGGRRVEPSYEFSKLEEIWPLLKANRLCNVLCDDDRLYDRQAAYKGSVWSTNAPALSTIFTLAPLLEEKSITYAFIKGPLMLHELYRDYFFRHSTDVDLLVAREHLQQAATVLEERGFVLEPDCKNAYWRYFLGEQHFSPPDEKLTLVDLHKFVRHPSGPSTNYMEEFLKPVVHHEIGDVLGAVPTFSNLALLLVIYILKGLMKYEPVGYFLVDFAVLLTRMDDKAIRQLVVDAEGKRLRRALCLSLQAVRMIAPISPLLEKALACERLKLMSDEELFRQLICPGQAKVWPRIRALVKTCDHPADLIQAFAWETGRKIAQRASDLSLF